MTEDTHTPCHWHRAEDGTTTLIPGCWGRVHDPDSDCTCGEWSEGTARETIRNMRAALYRERHRVQTLRAALRHAGLPEYPDDNAAPATPKAHDRSALDRMLAEAREKALREAAECAQSEGWCHQQPMIGFSEREEGSRDCAERIADAILDMIKGGK